MAPVNIILTVIFVSLISSFLKVGAHQLESYSLGIRDSIMIAHSFQGEEFGPAQNLHGATYTVDVEFIKPDLVEKSNWVRNDNNKSRLYSTASGIEILI